MQIVPTIDFITIYYDDACSLVVKMMSDICEAYTYVTPFNKHHT